MSNPLYISFLWHMHQPYYKDPVKGAYLLPWTYLHAVKDYYDMAAIVAETPGAKVVFNLVPSLLEQIGDYASGSAHDPFLVRGKMAPADMDDDDRLFILNNFFSANRQQMIEPNKRYLELLYLSGDGDRTRMTGRHRHFKDQDLLDLQVWFFLAWTGEVARRNYPGLNELVRKGRNFSPEDKTLLFDTQRAIIREIIPLYKRLHLAGKVELSVSPYYHPILPLLCDIKSAQAAMPRVTLPAIIFRHPGDARSQVEQGARYFEDTFGFPPAGMWPSEGAVSGEALGIIADCGFRWAATDEGVLSRSLSGGLGPGREALYHPHLFCPGDQELNLFFRDHALSDLIGFTYAQWSPEHAVTDFVARLRDIRNSSPESRVVSIILDGENAWEYYPDNGYHFLSRLYSTIANTPGLEPATFSEILAKATTDRVLTHIHPGSWINANYGVWVGHPEENRAWTFIARARETAVKGNSRVAAMLSRQEAPPPADNETAAMICQALFAAEGSDWFWWYGDDHFSPHSDRFDSLFRNQLMTIYRLLGLNIPRELFEPIKKKSTAGLIREPVAMITPTIDGLITDYFEWLSAGLYDLTKQASAMHAGESLLQSCFYGFDRDAFYFRIDGATWLSKTMTMVDRLALHLILDREYRLIMGLDADEALLETKTAAGWQAIDMPCRWKILRICEIEISLKGIKPERGSKIFCYVTLTRTDEEIGRWPTDAPMVLTYVGPEIELENWLI